MDTHLADLSAVLPSHRSEARLPGEGPVLPGAAPPTPMAASAPEPAAAPPVRKPRRRGRNALLTTASVVVVAAVAGGVFLISPYNHVYPVDVGRVGASVRRVAVQVQAAVPNLVAPAARLATAPSPERHDPPVRTVQAGRDGGDTLQQILSYRSAPAGRPPATPAGDGPAASAANIAGPQPAAAPGETAPVAVVPASGNRAPPVPPASPPAAPPAAPPASPAADPPLAEPAIRLPAPVRPGVPTTAQAGNLSPPAMAALPAAQGPTAVEAAAAPPAASDPIPAVAEPAQTTAAMPAPSALPAPPTNPPAPIPAAPAITPVSAGAPGAAAPAAAPADSAVVAVGLRAAPLTDQQQVEVLNLVTELGVLIRNQRTEIAQLRADQVSLRGRVDGAMTDFGRRLALAEARGAVSAAMGAGGSLGEPPPAPGAGPGSSDGASPAPGPRPTALPVAARAAVPQATASAPAPASGPHRYRVQAASPSLAMLSEIDATGDDRSQLQVVIGSEVPGYGRVTGIVQHGTSWQVRTDRGTIQ